MFSCVFLFLFKLCCLVSLLSFLFISKFCFWLCLVLLFSFASIATVLYCYIAAVLYCYIAAVLYCCDAIFLYTPHHTTHHTPHHPCLPTALGRLDGADAKDLSISCQPPQTNIHQHRPTPAATQPVPTNTN